MWEYLKWVGFINSAISLFRLLSKKNTWLYIYVYAPLLMVVCLLSVGLISYFIAPIAFEEQHLMQNSYSKAYGVYFLFTVLSVISLPLSWWMYKDYKNSKNKYLTK